MKIYMEQEETAMANTEEGNNILSTIIEDKEKPKSKYEGNKRTLAVVIDNVGDAVPQTGFNDAMIVYEAIAEGGLTRFLAVFKDPQVESIGPVRSARPYFIDYVLENDSIFAHYGGSPKALSELETLMIHNINGINVSEKIFYRTNKKKAPHNAILDVEEAWKYVAERGYRTTTTKKNVLNYDPENDIELESETVVNAVNIPYPTSTVKFAYNPETKLYERYVGNVLQKDWLTSETLTTKNIIITFAKNYTTSEENGYGRQAIENIGSLDGYYITNGKAIKIKCDKTKRDAQTVYKDLEGNEIKVNDGNTYIQIVPIDTAVTFE